MGHYADIGIMYQRKRQEIWTVRQEIWTVIYLQILNASDIAFAFEDVIRINPSSSR